MVSTHTDAATTLPLAGLKVLDVSTIVAGPLCCQVLGDYGADVVKIERVEGGDDSRQWPPHHHGALGHYFAAANRVVPPDKLLDEALDVARRLAKGPSLALAMTKRLLVNESSMDLESAIEQEAQAQALLLRAADHREFYDAWKEKREPRFTGR